MGTPLKNLGPSEACDDSVARSVAAGAGGFLVFGSLQAAGASPTIYREPLFVASGTLAAFLMTLTLSLAYYKRGRPRPEPGEARTPDLRFRNSECCFDES